MKHAVFPWRDYEYGPSDIMAVGNFGVMYRAYWKTRGIHVALKHVPRKSEAGRKVEAEERGALLQEEFDTRHKGIVPEIYEHGRSESGDYYISMELLDGRSLSTYLREETVTHEQAARIALWIAGDFLATLHAFRSGDGSNPADMIVYSDLKPDHVFVLRDGSMRALDFGITKRVQQANTSTVNPWASVPYASPRRLREGVVDRDADFWALGVMLYEMVAGHHPYPGLNAEAMSRAIERQDPPATLPPCDAGLAAIIRKLLAPQRHQSYQAADEIAADLRTMLDGGQPAALSARLDTSVPTMRVPAARVAPAAFGSVPTDPVPSPHGPLEPAGTGAPIAGVPAAGVPGAAAAAPAKRSRLRRFARAALFVVLGMMGLAELSAAFAAGSLRGRIDSIEAADVPALRNTVKDLRDGAPFGFAYNLRVRRPLTQRLVSLGERPILDYRTELPIVSKPQWEQARESLLLAREISPDDARIAARLTYVDAHLTRIAAADKPGAAQRKTLEEAVSAFKEAARLDPESPDPYLGLARIHAYDFKDFDALMQDLREAQRRGYRESRRERSQIADAYRFRADRTRLNARGLALGERLRMLRTAADDYDICADRFEDLSNFLDSDRNLRYCRQQADRLRLEIMRLEFEVGDFF